MLSLLYCGQEEHLECREILAATSRHKGRAHCSDAAGLGRGALTRDREQRTVRLRRWASDGEVRPACFGFQVVLMVAVCLQSFFRFVLRGCSYGELGPGGGYVYRPVPGSYALRSDV
jgi:hypothetical protein